MFPRNPFPLYSFCVILLTVGPLSSDGKAARVCSKGHGFEPCSFYLTFFFEISGFQKTCPAAPASCLHCSTLRRIFPRKPQKCILLDVSLLRKRAFKALILAFKSA